MRQLPYSFQLLNFKQQSTYVFRQYSVWMTLNGNVKVSGENAFALGRRDVAFFNSGEQIIVMPTFDNSILALNLEPSQFRDNIGVMNPVMTCNSVLVPGDYSGLINQLSRFAENYFTRTNDSWLTLMGQYYQLLGTLSGYLQNRSSAAEDGTGKNLRIQAIENYIYENYREPITLKDVADHLYLSPTYLSKYFTKNFGVNFYTYLQNVRLDYAVKALLIEKVPVTKAALDNGFSNISAFTTVFKRKFNMQPSKYIKMLEEQHLDAEADSVKELEYTKLRSEIQELAGDYSAEGELRVAQPQNQICIDRSASVQKVQPMRNIWNQIINLGSAFYCLNNNFQDQLASAQKTLQFRFARISDIIEVLIRADDRKQGQHQINFSDFNRIINFILSIGMKPFIELGQKTEKMHASPDGYFFKYQNNTEMSEETWRTLLKQLMIHCVNYWGAEEVAQWQIEIWLPHSEELLISEAGFDHYVQMFAAAEQVIKGIVPGLRIGGPGINLGGMSIYSSVGKLLDKMVQARVTPDFVSGYLYPSCDAETELIECHPRVRIKTLINTNEETNLKKAKNLRNTVHRFFPDMPIYITEIGSDAVSRATVNETCYKSSFIVKNAIDLWDKVDTLGYWQFSDLTQEHPDSQKIVFGGNGLVSRHGIRKCGYYAFWFLSKLGTHQVDRGENYILTATNAGRYALLVHNYKNLSDEYCTDYFKLDTIIPGERLFADVRYMSFRYLLQDMAPGRYIIKKYVLNSEHGNLADQASELNCWELARSEDIDYLKSVCVPKQSIMYQDCDGALEIIAELEPLEVVLFTIERSLDL